MTAGRLGVERGTQERESKLLTFGLRPPLQLFVLIHLARRLQDKDIAIARIIRVELRKKVAVEEND